MPRAVSLDERRADYLSRGWLTNAGTAERTWRGWNILLRRNNGLWGGRAMRWDSRWASVQVQPIHMTVDDAKLAAFNGMVASPVWKP